MTASSEIPPVEPDAPILPADARIHVPPWMQLVGLPLLVLFGFLFLKAASHAAVVFLIAGLISILLAPLVRALVHLGLPRLVSVLFVFGAFASLVTVIALVAVDLIAAQAVEVRDNSTDIGNVAVEHIDELQSFVDDHGWDIDVRDQGVRFVEQLEERSTELSGEALEYGREFVTILAEAAFNLTLIVVITIYMLLDAPRISRMFASMLPPGSGAEGLFGRMERSLLRYTVGQTLASLVMGLSATAGLWIMGQVGIWEQADDYAVLFGLFVAVTEFAPSIGPVIGAIPPIVTAAFDGLGPAIAVALFFIALHQIEGHIVIPKLMGAAIAVHPLLVIFGILAGAQLMGIGGVLLALPLLAVGRELVVFFRERVRLGTWPSSAPGAVFGTAMAGGGSGSRSAGAADAGAGAAATAVPTQVAVRTRLRDALAKRRRAVRNDEPSDGDE